MLQYWRYCYYHEGLEELRRGVYGLHGGRHAVSRERIEEMRCEDNPKLLRRDEKKLFQVHKQQSEVVACARPRLQVLAAGTHAVGQVTEH